MERIILLNADYTFLNTVTWKKAFALVAKSKVEVLKYSDRVIRSAAGAVLHIPLVMRLIKIIRTIYKARVPFSKKNVMVRDGFKCVYCGGAGMRFTIDHVVPKSRGGKSTFENCVTACKPCNHRKGHRSCLEVKMFPKTQLIAPTIAEFLRMKLHTLGIQKTLDDLFAKI
jgi:5-methylcytosine-specific restriction endonuclease McrA